VLLGKERWEVEVWHKEKKKKKRRGVREGTEKGKSKRKNRKDGPFPVKENG